MARMVSQLLVLHIPVHGPSMLISATSHNLSDDLADLREKLLLVGSYKGPPDIFVDVDISFLPLISLLYYWPAKNYLC
jgi:hypothetical protein